MKRPLSLTIRIYLSWAIYLPVVGISFIVAWLDRKLRFPLSFPRDVDQLQNQKDWLIAELKKNDTLPVDAEPTECIVRPMDQSSIFRSDAATITIQYIAQDGPRTLRCFAKFAPSMGTVWNRTIFNLQLNHIKESWFNEYFVNQDGIPAPKVFIAKVSAATGNLCLVTELMNGDMEYRECAYDHLRGEHLDLALDGLATLHARYWGDRSERMKRIMPIDDMTVHFFDSLVARKWSIPARKVLVKCWIWTNNPQTVLHGDARIGNMMFPIAADGRYVLIDWQATRKGRAAFDLAYFLILSLISSHRKAVEETSKQRYYDLLVIKGVTGYTREDFEEDYRHASLCVLVLLSLPMLSGEVSVEGFAALIFVYGMHVWRERMRIHFEDFDYKWLAANYDITEQEAHSAVAEMLAVIQARLDGISAASGVRESLRDILKRNNERYDYEI